MASDDLRKAEDKARESLIEAVFTSVTGGRVIETRSAVCSAETWEDDERSDDPSWYVARLDGLVLAVRVKALGDSPPMPRMLTEWAAPSSN